MIQTSCKPWKTFFYILLKLLYVLIIVNYESNFVLLPMPAKSPLAFSSEVGSQASARPKSLPSARKARQGSPLETPPTPPLRKPPKPPKVQWAECGGIRRHAGRSRVRQNWRAKIYRRRLQPMLPDLREF